MASRSLLAIAITLCSTVALLPSLPAAADTPLNRATVQNLRNQVELFLKQQRPRSAQKADVMTPGDALQTYRSAMAELRFNDNSLARVGEQAIFQFVPNSRNLELKKGTVLLFITPKQGRTRVRTPNAAAGIRGSALFVRYNEGITTVGALTNSGIEVCNNDASKCVVLQAGEMGYVYNDQVGVYKFDQKVFQETSPLFKDIALDQVPEVKEEIQQALKEQGTFVGTYENTPAWLKLASNRNAPVASQASTPTPAGLQPSSLLDRPDVAVFPTGTPAATSVVAGPPTTLTAGSPAVEPARPVPVVPAVTRPIPIAPTTQVAPPPTSSLVNPPTLPPAAPPTPAAVPAAAPPTPVSLPTVQTSPATPAATAPVDTPVVQPAPAATTAPATPVTRPAPTTP